MKSVQNEIEVLPLSPNDDRIRAAVYRSIYGWGPLQRYTSNRGAGASMNQNIASLVARVASPPIRRSAGMPFTSLSKTGT